MTRFPIRFGRLYALLSRAALLPPSKSFVDVGLHEIHVRMAWAFDARFPRAAVKSIAPLDRRPLSRGVHGYGGRWLVNGSGDQILLLTLEPEQRAKVMGAPVTLRELWISLEDPEGFTRAVKGPADPPGLSRAARSPA